MKRLVTLALVLFTFTAFSQDFYWVGGSGNWSDFANHWATTSGGSTFHTAAPTSTNDVFFDANSFSASGQVVTLDVVADCQSMDWSGITNFPSIVADGNDLNVFGSLTLASDMTADLDDVDFESTTTGNTITSNGTPWGAGADLTFIGEGGEWTLMDNVDGRSLDVIAGSFVTNNNDITLSNRFNITGSTSKSITLGTSTITLNQWQMSSTGNTTLDAGTSTIQVENFSGDTNADGPYTYYNIEINESGWLRNSFTANDITIGAGFGVQMTSGATITVLGDFTAIGTKHDIIDMYVTTTGSEATISIGKDVTAEYIELEDVHIIGGFTYTANNAVDNGNNTGWTINELVGLDYFWVGDSGDWTDFANHWATTSGGTTMHTDYPDKLDDVYFDANSFSTTGQTVKQDLEGGVNFHDMDWTGALNEPTLTSSFQFNFNAYGSVIFIPEMTRSLYGLDLEAEETGLTLDPAGSGGITFLSFNGAGEYDLVGDVSVSVFNHRNGTINYGDISIECSIDFDLGNGSNSPFANFGNTTITCRDFTKFASSTPIITGTPSITVERDFQGNGIALYEVIMDGIGEVEGSNTFENFEVTVGSSVSFANGETQTVNQVLTLTGSKSSPINLSSDLAGTQANISVASGTIDASYLVMQDINATGGATFNAAQTIDNGNNTGWSISGLVGAEYYWVGDAGTWTDFTNHWATTSGGSTMHVDEPGVLDDVFFDANSFTQPDQTVTIEADISFNDMTWTGVSDDPTFDSNGNALNVYGSLTFDPTMTIGLDDVYFLAEDAESITLQDDAPGTNSYFHFTGSGSWTFESGLTVREFNHHSGDIDINSQTVHIDFSLNFFGTEPKTMILGDSEFFTRSFSIGSADNVAFDGSTSSITSSSSFSTLGGSGNTYTFNDFTFIRYNSTDEGRFSNDMSFNTLTFDADTDIELRAGTTVTVNNLVAVGTADDPIAIYSQTEGTTASISQATGTVDAFYLELQDVTASGGATFNAFSSVDNGNVSGWAFFRTAQTIDFPEISDVALGAAPFELIATASSGLDVEFSIVSGPATIDGTTITVTGGGTVQVRAEQAGDIDFEPAPSVINTFDVTKADQTITFDPIPAQILSDGTYVLVATGGGSTSPVTFTSSDLAVATISGTTVTLLSEGTTTITAEQLGDDDYNDATPVDQDLTIVVGNQSQTITFAALPDKTIGDADFELEATASSDLIVSYTSSDESVATIAGSVVTIVGVGSTTITASQAGDLVYDPAADVEQLLTVNAATQEITFAALDAKTFGDAPFELEASASSDLTVSYTSSDESVATIVGSMVTIVGAGTTTITASQAGNDGYDPALDVAQALVVNPITQEITFDALASGSYGDDAFELTASINSELSISFVSSDESVASIDGSTVTIMGVGTSTITASQSGDVNHSAATDVLQDLVVEAATLTATVEDKEKVYGDANPELTVVYTGFVNEEDETVLITVPTVSTTVTAATEVGEHPITIQGGSAGNYELSRVEGVMTITKRSLTATADDQYMREGDVVPVLTISYAELVNGDSGSDIDIPPAITTTATSTSVAGDYPVTLAGGEDNNYLISLVDGVLTVDVALGFREVSDLIKMYPNPVSDFLLVDSPNGSSYELEIRSMAGQLLDSYEIKSKQAIDLRTKTAGTYLVILKEEGIIKGTSRLIVE